MKNEYLYKSLLEAFGGIKALEGGGDIFPIFEGRLLGSFFFILLLKDNGQRIATNGQRSKNNISYHLGS
jgi:hypothetical protein